MALTNQIRSTITLNEVENGWVINAFVPNPDFKEGGEPGFAPSLNQQFVATTDAQAIAAVEKALKAAAGKPAAK